MTRQRHCSEIGDRNRGLNTFLGLSFFLLLDMKSSHAALTMEELENFRRHIRIGRPLGDADFLARLETLLSRPLLKRKPGPKPNTPERQVRGQMELWEN